MSAIECTPKKKKPPQKTKKKKKKIVKTLAWFNICFAPHLIVLEQKQSLFLYHLVALASEVELQRSICQA